jgi:hypothetical protein
VRGDIAATEMGAVQEGKGVALDVPVGCRVSRPSARGGQRSSESRRGAPRKGEDPGTYPSVSVPRSGDGDRSLVANVHRA